MASTSGEETRVEGKPSPGHRHLACGAHRLEACATPEGPSGGRGPTVAAVAWLLGAAIVAALVTVATVALRVRATKKPDLLGNSPENVRRLTQKANPDHLVFYAVGDLRQGMRTFEKLLDILSQDKPDFVVILGDFAPERCPAGHQIFVHDMAAQDLSFPVFVVLGNHDAKIGTSFQLRDFEQLYGPAQFHFTIGRNLFLFLNNAHGWYDRTLGYIRYMERALSESAGAVDRVFVFAHTPPMGLTPLLHAHKLAGSERYRRLAKKYRVDYVFAGDHHGYWKGVRDGTTYIVSGGGGAKLRGARGAFHHAVRIEVEQGHVSDSVIAVERRNQGLRVIRRNIVLYTWAFLSSGRARTAALVLLLAAGGAVLVFLGVRRRRRRAAAPPPRSACSLPLAAADPPQEGEK